MMDLYKYTPLTFLLLALLQPTLSQFPRRCTDDASLRLRQCCPVGADGSRCGQLSNRGNCTDIRPYLPQLSIAETCELLLDDRAWWPMAFYDKACQCNNNFDGVDCSKCKPGYEGEDCSIQSPLKTRKNILNLTLNELRNYVNILNRSKYVNSEEYVILTTSYKKIVEDQGTPEFRNVSIYNIFVWLHYYVTKNPYRFPNECLSMINSANMPSTHEERQNFARTWLQQNPNLTNIAKEYAHEGPAFLPWHRYLMLKWEAEIREHVDETSSFVFSYWDWRGKSTCDVCSNEIVGERNSENISLLSDSSPFSRWQVICTNATAYMDMDMQCAGDDEGSILRNFSNFDSEKISGLPTVTEVENIYTLASTFDTPDYDIKSSFSFRSLLEGFGNPETGRRDTNMSYLHNAIHIYMNGTMSDVDRSANDPIFTLHHTFIDSLFERWLLNLTLNHTYEDNIRPRMGHRPQDYMVPFFPLVTIREGFSFGRDLGYVYDYLESTEASSAPTGLEPWKSASITVACVLYVVLTVG